MWRRAETRPALAVLALGLSLLASWTAVGCQSSGCRSGPDQPAAGESPEAPTAAEAKGDLAATVRRLVDELGEDETREGATAALGAIGEAAVSQLTAALDGADADTRIAVLDALEAIGGPSTTEALLRAVNDSDEDVRLRAVEVLGTVRDRRAAPSLIERYATDGDDQVRYEILTTLGLIGDPAASELLVGETANDDRYARMWAMDALCEMRDPNAPRLAVALLRDSDVFVRRQVLSSCATAFDDDAGHAALVETVLSADDFDETVRARRNLQTYLKEPAQAERLRERIRTAALPALAGKHGQNAALLLADIGDPAGVEELVVALRSPDHFVRHHAAYQLGRLGATDAVPSLIEALSDEQPLVAATAHDALRALAERGDERAKQAVASYAGPRFDRRLSPQSVGPRAE